MDKRRTLYQLRLEHGVNIYALSQASRVSSFAVWSMLIGNEVTREDAVKILDGLNKLKGTHYTLEDIDVVLTKEDGDDAPHKRVPL